MHTHNSAASIKESHHINQLLKKKKKKKKKMMMRRKITLTKKRNSCSNLRSKRNLCLSTRLITTPRLLILTLKVNKMTTSARAASGSRLQRII